MIMNNLGPGSSLESDRLARALINTAIFLIPSLECHLLRSNLGLTSVSICHCNQDTAVCVVWRMIMNADMQQRALAQRYLAKHEQLSRPRGSKQLPPLAQDWPCAIDARL